MGKDDSGEGPMESPLGTARRRKPWLAGLLSLWVPGLGHLYSGRWKRALAFWLGGPILVWGLAIAGLPMSFIGLAAWACIGLLYQFSVAWDAVRSARSSPNYRLRPFNRWYLYLLCGLLANLAASSFVAALPVKTFFIPAASMEPTLRLEDRLVVDMTYWRSHVPSRGDLVVFASPENLNVLAIKRILAVAGDRIEIRDKTVFINGQPLAHDWGIHSDSRLIAGAGRDNYGPFVVPPDTVFALGDNRDNSYDSRFFGPVPTHLLRGRPLFL